MFSIIIPVYNVEKYLDKCLQSAIRQTYCDIEIVVVNDGSTDKSAEIIEKYRSQDARIKVVTQENAGPGAARNSGLKAAGKEYVMFVDSDDFIEDNACERLAEYIKEDRCDVYVFGLYYDAGNKKNAGRQSLHHKKYLDGREYMEAALINSSFRTFAHSKLFRREMLTANGEEVKFVEGLLYEDMLFIVQALCKAKSVSTIPECLYHYVQHQSGRITVRHNNKDLDVLTFVDMLNRGYYKTGEINKIIYAVLTFRWVSSCLIRKYIGRYFSDSLAKEVINTVINDPNFAETVRLCAKIRGIPKRDKYPALLLTVSPFLYKLAVYCIVRLRG